jgi:hypothetical protein
MSGSDFAPGGPAGQEPLEELFGTVFDLAGEVVSHISPAEVEARLRRVLQEAERHPEGLLGSDTAAHIDEPADTRLVLAAAGRAQHLRQPETSPRHQPGQLAAGQTIPAGRQMAARKPEDPRSRILSAPGPGDGPSEGAEAAPVVVMSQTFLARPSSLPDVREFVRRCLARSPLSEEDNREVAETVAHALLEAAGPTGAVSISFRIFPSHVEVDVLRSGAQVGTPAGLDALASLLKSQAADMKAPTTGQAGSGAGRHGPEEAAFADWMADVLRREGMTVEVAARQLGTSVKTVSRWISGTAEPRLRDLRRIHELFGDFPSPDTSGRRTS